jgi:hypothetical protein
MKPSITHLFGLNWATGYTMVRIQLATPELPAGHGGVGTAWGRIRFRA